MVELCCGGIWEGYICARPQANRSESVLGYPSSQRVSETVRSWPFWHNLRWRRQEKGSRSIELLWY